MKFAVIGVGGVGGYFGARLAADGNDVAFIARGAHRAAMEKNGLRVRSPYGDVHLEAPQIVQEPDEAGLCDFVLVCVKMQDLRAAAEAVRPLLAHDTAVVSFQNGVEAEDLLAEALGARFVMGGVAYIFANIAEPGVIVHHGGPARLVFGELDGSETWRQEALLSACIGAGIDAEAVPDIRARIWKKFAMLAPLAGATCLGRCSVGAARDDPALRAKLEAMTDETIAVGRAAGVDLPDDLAARTLTSIGRLDAGMKTSMLHDLEAGKPLELDWINGAVVRLGRKHGIATPANAEALEALRPYAAGAG